jgi:hypothetical protein
LAFILPHHPLSVTHYRQGYLDHRQLAIDGKTIRATSTQPHLVYLLSGYDVTTGTVLWQRNVEEKQNEISALKPLLTPSLVLIITHKPKSPRRGS